MRKKKAAGERSPGRLCVAAMYVRCLAYARSATALATTSATLLSSALGMI